MACSNHESLLIIISIFSYLLRIDNSGRSMICIIELISETIKSRKHVVHQKIGQFLVNRFL